MLKMARQRWIERDFMILQLFNGGGQPDPKEYKTPKGMQGINVRFSHLN